jgi:predicted cobalt transporter CbtA
MPTQPRTDDAAPAPAPAVGPAPAAKPEGSGPDPADALRAAVTEVADLVAALGGDVGSLASTGTTHAGPVAARHGELSAAVLRLRAAADSLTAGQ